MKQKIFLTALIFFVATLTFSQVIKRVNGTKLTTDSLQKKVDWR